MNEQEVAEVDGGCTLSCTVPFIIILDGKTSVLKIFGRTSVGFLLLSRKLYKKCQKVTIVSLLTWETTFCFPRFPDGTVDCDTTAKLMGNSRHQVQI